jgi:hypothetical protein
MEGLERFDGHVYKSILTGNLYKVSRIVTDTRMAVLDSLDGKSQVLTHVGNLKHFYKTSDYGEGS